MKSVAKSIKMIAWFDEDGKINPMKFKIEGEDEGKVIHINRILNRELEKLAGNIMWKFTCTSIVDDTEYIYNINYDLINCRWLLLSY